MTKSYATVLEMVKDLSGKKFYRKFKKLQKKRTVYVLVDNKNNQLEIFRKLKSAKMIAQKRFSNKKWHFVDNVYILDDDFAKIFEKKILN